MSSGRKASQNRTAPEDQPIETCRQLLNSRNFRDAWFVAHMNQLVCHTRYDEFEKIRAICDVLIAAEHRFPMDYYGMLRVTPLGPVLLEDFKKLMKLLDWRHNRFPYSQEAAQEALQAWSLLSKPQIKAEYDLGLSRWIGSSSPNGGGFVVKGKGKGKKESEYSKRSRRMYMNPFQSGLHNSFISKKLNVGPGTDDVVVTISDNNDDDDQWNMTLAEAVKLFKVKGKGVKVAPLKKKQE